MNRELAERLVEGARKEFGDSSIKLLRFDEDTVTMTNGDRFSEPDTLDVKTRTLLKITGAEGCELAAIDLEDRSVTFVNKIGGPVEVRREIIKEVWLTNGWCRVGDIIQT